MTIVSTNAVDNALGIATAVSINLMPFGRGGGGVFTNTSFGELSMVATNSGVRNTAFGTNTLNGNTTGHDNTALGANVLFSNVTGTDNTGVGAQVLLSSTGSFNTAEGSNALGALTNGASNTAYGYSALRQNSTGSGNVAIGAHAGRFELGSNAFYVNNTNQTTTALDKTNSLMYGVFNAAPASQTLMVNAVLSTSIIGNAAGNVVTTNGAQTLTNKTIGVAQLSGAVAIANGGTGQTTAALAINALVPTQTGNSGKFLTTNGTVVSWATVSGSGTVTGVSVVTANGFAGSATGAPTPAITLTTTIAGVLKGNGTAISAATSGTDYSLGTSALATGILKSTTTTGALTIAIASDFPTLNQDTTGKSAKTDALNSATTVVNVSAATAPTLGQILTANDSTHATWQSPIVFNVKTYGAAGDNITDDTTAIQSAITAATTTKGVVFFPAATYKITTPLTMVAGVTLQGAGKAASIIHQSGANQNGLNLTSASEIVYEASIKDLGVLGTGSGTGIGINIKTTAAHPLDYGSITDVDVTSFGSHGIFLGGPIVWKLEGVKTASNGGNGFYIDGTVSFVTSISFSACYANGNTGDGYHFVQVNYSSLNGCAADGNAIGYYAKDVAGISFNGCGAEVNGTNFKIDSGAIFGTASVAFNGCLSQSATTNGYWITGVSTVGVVFNGSSDETPGVKSLLVDSGAVVTSTGSTFGGTITVTGSYTILSDLNGDSYLRTTYANEFIATDNTRAIGSSTGSIQMTTSSGQNFIESVGTGNTGGADLIISDKNVGTAYGVWTHSNGYFGLLNIFSPNSPLQVGGAISTNIAYKNANYTLTGLDSVITADSSAGTITLTLPTAVTTTGRQYTIKKVVSGNSVIIATTASQTIDGSSTLTLTTLNSSAVLVSDGVNWYQTASNGSGGGAVSSVSNSDGTLTISPTTGAVVASLALGHANSWTGQQTFGTSAPIFSTMTAGSVLYAGTSGLLSQDNANFFWDAINHRLGIGTTTPGVKLDVVGEGRFKIDNEALNLTSGSVNHTVYQVYTNGTSSAYAGVNSTSGGDIVSGSAAYAYVFNQSGNFPMQFATNNSLRATLLGSGNFGIGTASPDTILHIVGSFKMVDGNQALNKVMTSDANGVGSWQVASGRKMRIDLLPAAAEITGAATDPLLVGIAGTNSKWSQLNFNDTTQMYADYVNTQAMTTDYSGGAITIVINWTAVATSGAVKWQVKMLSRTAAQIMDTAYDATNAHTVTTTVVGTTLQINQSSLSWTPIAGELTAGTLLLCQISRVAADGADTMTGDAQVVGVSITEN